MEILIYVLLLGGHPVAYTTDESACLSMQAPGSVCYEVWVDETDLDAGTIDAMLANYVIICDERA